MAYNDIVESEGKTGLLRALRYVRSVFELFLGVFLGFGLVGAAIKALVGIGLLFLYWSFYNFGMTVGDALAALIAFLIVRWLIRDGYRVWALARASGAR